MLHKGLFAIPAFLISLGCSGKHEAFDLKAPILDKPIAGELTLEPVEPTSEALVFSVISQKVLQPRCIECHSSTRQEGGVDITNYQALMAEPLPWIVPGDPEASDLVKIIESGEMPRRRPKVTEEELELLKEWIRLGAPESVVDIEGELELEPEAESEPAPAPAPAETPLFPPVMVPEISIQTTELVTFERVFNEIFEPKCARCHYGPYGEDGVDISSADALINNFAYPDLVVKGNPQGSRLYRAVASGFMPLRSAALTREELELLRLWIYEGAEL